MKVHRPTTGFTLLLRQLGQRPHTNRGAHPSSPSPSTSQPQNEQLRGAVVEALQRLTPEKRKDQAYIRQVFVETVIGSAYADRLTLGELQPMRDDILHTLNNDPDLGQQFDRIIARFLS
ncbi:hypothetical protein [Parendozoicomonas haliclonae]|uniref:Uncharacterized protein n=1 Tax=Parendozoicomonas haliclonae TaxID=1960125 RepID=A0A1X7ANQ5_9GAMM|nr:hypothetical protein [Parendozoicomonas haliclonae]SMA49895.1 hypothetical protein EHSB41UT_03686 [Parendozoicomonas haliclonae]